MSHPNSIHPSTLLQQRIDSVRRYDIIFGSCAKRDRGGRGVRVKRGITSGARLQPLQVATMLVFIYITIFS